LSPTTAVWDRDGGYRYVLETSWPEGTGGPLVAVLSHAVDDESDGPDETVRWLAALARSRRHSGLIVVSLCAYVSAGAAALKNVADPVGPRNDAILEAYVEAIAGGVMLVAWGDPQGSTRLKRLVRERAQLVEGWAARHDVRLRCLGVTEQGNPCAPSIRSGPAALTPFASLTADVRGGR
jgi:hypothetical protein